MREAVEEEHLSLEKKYLETLTKREEMESGFMNLKKDLETTTLRLPHIEEELQREKFLRETAAGLWI